MNNEQNNMEEYWWKNDPNADKNAIGVILHRIADQWTVYRTLMGSPAEKVGLENGDILLAIGGNPLSSGIGESVIEKTLSFLPEGEKVEIVVVRSQKSLSVKTSFEHLEKLLEQDFKLGGAEKGYCKSCENCRKRATGYSDCKLEGGNCLVYCSTA